MKARYILLLSAAALMTFGCQQADDINSDKPAPTPGKEVKFGATLSENPETKTIYGEEEINGSSWSFPIKWMKNDQLVITSPQCPEGSNTATYKVTCEDGSEYAGQLQKTGDHGVIWGSSATADFYSVYPAAGATVNGTTFSVSIPATQTNTIKFKANGTQYANPNMDACVMYAKETGVNNGETVDLTYNPLSTALRFTVKGPSSGGGLSGIQVLKVVLHAPVPIVGGFSVDLSGATPVVTPAASAKTDLTIYAAYENQSYLTLNPGEEVELNAFIIPVEREVNNDWYLEITLVNNKTFKKKLGMASTATTAQKTLMPGKIHRLPGLPNIDDNTPMNPQNWMVNIPRNVYLSEVSLPGSWNSLNSDFQENVADYAAAITAQYNAGCRAFHIDTRWRADKERGWEDVAGFGWRYYYEKTGGSVFHPVYTRYSDINNLSVANGSQALDVRYGYSSGGQLIPDISVQDGKVMKPSAPLFSDVLNTIVSKVQPEEYMVVMCTFAQNSFQHTTAFTEGYKSWMNAINDACNGNSNIYDARNITSNTVVGDVLGKVIVIVNCEGNIADQDISENSKCLFVNAPLTLTQEMFTGTYNNSDFYKGNKSAIDVDLYYTQAQIMDDGSGSSGGDRGYKPSFTQRETIAGNILNYAMTNFAKTDYAHNAWMYLGLGGYLDGDSGIPSGYNRYTHVANRLNNWIKGKVDAMSSRPTTGQTPYYPVGIVLMNFVTNTTYGTPAVNAIYQMNNKFIKAYDPQRSPIDGSPIIQGDVQSAAPGYSSGMVDNNQNAISAD